VDGRDLAGPQAVATFGRVEDEAIAGRSSATLLITAAHGNVESLARRIHLAGRPALPFVQASARDLPIEPVTLQETCSRLLDAVGGGSMLLTSVEEMPLPVQDVFLELLADLRSARNPSATATVRLIAGTTVSLLDCIATGTFSERLFYRLNVIHLIVPTNASPVVPPVTRFEG